MARAVVAGARVRSAEDAAARAASTIAAMLRFGEPPRFGVPGGRTPGRIFERLLEWKETLKNAEVLFADERAVPRDDPESNYRLLKEKLLDPLGEETPRVIPMRADGDDLEGAAREYERHLVKPLSVLLLGLGEDGHIASLFPHSPLLDERERRVAAVYDSPKPPSRRLTITPRVLVEAGFVVVVATGREKRAAVTRALRDAGDARDCPARLVRNRMWIVDDEAGAGLDDSVLQRA